MARKQHRHGGYSDDAALPLSTINTTPLVDVMLVLLIIFLITIPVVIKTVPLTLPEESANAAKLSAQTVVISVDRQGQMYWNAQKLTDDAALIQRLHVLAERQPTAEIHLRADAESRYEPIGRLVGVLQQSGINRVSFITEPEK